MGSFEDFLDRERRDFEAGRQRLQGATQGLTKRLMSTGQSKVNELRHGGDTAETVGQGSPGDSAIKAGNAVGWGGVAHDAVTTVGKMAADNAAHAKILEHAFRPLALGLNLAEAGLTALGSHQNREPLDVTLVRAGLPILDGMAGAGIGTLGGPPGEFIGAAAGAMYGGHVADQYAEARAARLRKMRGGRE